MFVVAFKVVVVPVKAISVPDIRIPTAVELEVHKFKIPPFEYITSSPVAIFGFTEPANASKRKLRYDIDAPEFPM